MIKDWRYCDQSLVEMQLDKNYLYYIHAQAWHIKGYLGGTHSYCAFYHAGDWLVVELSDQETLDVQGGETVYIGTESYYDRAPCISKRPFNAKWFGHRPHIIDKCRLPAYDDILAVCKNYPLGQFKIFTQNCNTFISYLIHELGLEMRRPIRSVGFRNNLWWEKFKNA